MEQLGDFNFGNGSLIEIVADRKLGQLSFWGKLEGDWVQTWVAHENDRLKRGDLWFAISINDKEDWI